MKFKPGQLVHHEKWGVGIIRTMDEKKSTVMFEMTKVGYKVVMNDDLSANVPVIHSRVDGQMEAWLKPCPKWVM